MGLALGAGCLLFAGPGAACSDSCGDVDCGSGVEVGWEPESLPGGVVAVQLCVDERCDEAGPPTGAIAPSSAPGVEDITVELRLLSATGEVVDTWRWTGDREGACCPHVDLVEVDGELVPREIG
jgi:hypothetical protein